MGREKKWWRRVGWRMALRDIAELHSCLATGWRGLWVTNDETSQAVHVESDICTLKISKHRTAGLVRPVCEISANNIHMIQLRITD